MLSVVRISRIRRVWNEYFTMNEGKWQFFRDAGKSCVLGGFPIKSWIENCRREE